MSDTKISDLAAVTDVIGTDEYVLARAGATKKIDATDLAAGLVSGDPIDETIVNAKGDLIAATAADTVTRLGVGTDGDVLTADSGEATGLAWAAPAPGGSGAMEMICDSTLGSNQNTFDTNTILSGNIAGTYTHLLIELVARSSRASNTTDFFHLRFNNDSGSNYDTQYHQANDSNAFAAGRTQATSGIGSTSATAALGLVPAASSASGMAASYVMDIPGYAGTTFHKTLHSRGLACLDTGDIRHWGAVGLWRSTSAITRVTLTMINGDFLTGSRFTLYGID